MDRKTREALIVAKNVTGRASGGRTRPFALYSKAAEVARNLPQAKGSVDQMMAMLRKAGVKPAEIEHAGVPEGKTITREELARHFENSAPNIKVSQYGEDPVSHVRSQSARRMNEIMRNWPNATPEEREEWSRLERAVMGNKKNVISDEETDEPEPTQYEDYVLPGGQNYRERLIHLPSRPNETVHVVRNYYAGDSRTFSDPEEAKAYADELERRAGGERSIITQRRVPAKEDYISKHWDTPNIIAHIRLTDRTAGWNPAKTAEVAQRIADHMGVKPHELGSGAAKYGVDNGLITPEEAATLSQRYGWRNEFRDKKGAEKRILHVEELQSDWAQGGRDKGFYNPEKPYQIFRTDTGETLSEHPTYEEMWDAFRSMPEDQARGVDYGHVGKEDKHPAGPYVKNTQHWTDLALKNVLFEAATGGYDHVVFTPGQASADRYGLEKQLSRVRLVRHPDTNTLGTLNAWDREGRRSASEQINDEGHLAQMIGAEAAQKLLAAPKVDAAEGFGFTPGTYAHTLEGDDLRMGGRGMKAYYDQIVPKSVMRLVQQHDPEITPGTMELPGTEQGQTYQGFSIPVTDKLREGIIKNGQTMFKRGGRVGYNVGGYVPQANLPVGRLRTAIPHRPPEMPAAGQAIATLAGIGKKAVGLGNMMGYGAPEAQKANDTVEGGAGNDTLSGSGKKDPLALAATQIGLNENAQREALKDYLTTGGANLDPATTAWCAAFVNSTLQQSGYEGTGSNLARSFLNWGQPAETPQPGDIAVFSRGDPNGPYGHVGFFKGYDDQGNILVLGGNQSNSVSVSPYSADRLLGFRRYASGGSVGGNLEKERAKEAVERAGGQIAPSQYLPDVPRAVHADGGAVSPKERFLAGNHPSVPEVLYHGTVEDFPSFYPLSHFGTMKAAHQRMDPHDAWSSHPAGITSKVNIIPVHVRMRNPLDVGTEGKSGGKDYWDTHAAMLNQVMDTLYEKGHRRQADNLQGIIDNMAEDDRYGKDLIPHLKRAANEIEDAGYDGISYINQIEDKGSRSFVSLFPHQVKSAISARQFDPNNPDMRFADGGEVADLGAAREQKQLRQYHGGLMGDIRGQMSTLREAHQKAVDAGAFDGYQVGDTLAAKAGPMKITGMFVRKWKPSSFMVRHFDRMGVEPTLIEHEGEQYVPMLRYQTGREGDEGWQEGDAYMDMVRAAGYPKMGGLRAVKARGGGVSGRDQFYGEMHPDLMDEEGKPLDLYHGTPGAPFDAFDDEKIGQRDAGFYGRGHYLTPDRDLAEEYIHTPDGDQGSVMGPLHASLKNPFIWDLSDEAKADRTKRKLVDFGVMKGHEGQLKTWDNLKSWEVDKFTRAAMAAGHDGVIMKASNIPTEIVVFNPAKIKHATKNSGAFDTTDRNIYKAEGGPVDGDPQATTGAPQARPAQGGLPVAGGLGGGSGVLPAQNQAPREADLEGLPKRVKIPLTGEVIEAGGDPRVRQVARDYMASAGLPYSPPTKYAKVDPNRSKRIAAAYEAMEHNPDHPLVKASYAQMIKETMDQYRAAKAAGFKAEFWNPATEKDPYDASPRLAVEDVRKNHHMYVYPTSAGYGTGQEITEEDIRQNPMLMDSGERWNGVPVTVNDIFRAVHDYYGHAKEGVGFRADGEENAWRAHASMFSPLARMAMTTETRGQNSWLNYGPHGEANRTARTEDTVFAPQKVGVLPHWVHHEGAEDFVTPESIQQMAEIMRRHDMLENDVVGDALRLTRGAFRDGGAPGFFSKEAGQARRQALNEAVSRFIPPGLRPMAEAVGSMTPVASLERAGQASQQAFDPSAAAGDRMASGATALAETLGVAAPLALVGRAAIPATQIAREVLTGGYNPDFGQGWQDVYHWSRSPDAFDVFDPSMSREAFSRIGPHVGTQRAAYDRYMQEPEAIGQTMPLKADLSRPFLRPDTEEPFSELQMQNLIADVAREHGVDPQGAAKIIRDRLAARGYTNIPYRNDAEDPGSISHVMLTERPAGSEAVLRSRFAEFSPHRATSKSLLASGVPAAVGLAAYRDDDYQDGPR